MGHMVVYRMVVIDQIEMTWLEMEDCWKLRIGEGIDIGIILVMIQIGTMIIFDIILTRGVTRGIFQMSLRKKMHLSLMER